MTTNEAAKLAAELWDQGVRPMKKISKELARNGYISSKTGKPMGSAGLFSLIKKFKSGAPIADRKARKFKDAHVRHEPRPKKPQSGPVPPFVDKVREVSADMNPPRVSIANEIAHEQTARATLKKAMERVLFRLFDIHAVVQLPLDKSIRPTHE